MFEFVKKLRAPMFEAVAREWLEINYSDKAAKTKRDVLNRLESYVFPRIGALRVSKIETADIYEILKAYSDTAPKSINRMFQSLKNIFDFADAKLGFELENPVRESIKLLITRQPSEEFYFIPPAEMPEFFRKLHTHKMKNEIRAAIMLLIFTAARRKEVMAASWQEIDLKNKIWTIPASRMKARRDHVMPITVQALQILQYLKAQSASDRIFSVSGETVLRHIQAIEPRATLHGFRKTFSTYAHESGKWSVDAIEMSIAHKINGVRGVYNKAQYIEERRQLMGWYAKELNKWGARHIVSQILR